MLSRMGRIVAAVFVSFVIVAATSPVSTRGGAFVIRNVRIFDGEKIIADNSVAVADGKIVAVGRNLAPPAGAQVIDGTGDTLLPGLIDSHVHAWIRDVLKMDLVMGVTTDLDMYMWSQNIAPWRTQEAQGASDAADFRTAGTAIAVAGGHGTVESDLPKMIPIQGPEQAQAFVDERIAQGSDYIKVFYDNGPRFASMTKETLVAIVKAAHARHKMVIVHVFSAQGYLDAIDAGADGLAHVPIVKLPEPQFRDALRSHQLFAITTLGYTDFFFGAQRLWLKLADDPLIAPYLSRVARQMLAQPAYLNREHISYADNEANLRTLRDAGVPILAGTDANDAQSGALLQAELELMVKAGLSPTETLADATSVPAKIFALNDRGRIATGMRADLLLVRGDPTRDIRKTRDIVAIWKQGRPVNRESVREKLAPDYEAWKFGAGWMSDTDQIFKGTSTERLQTAVGGPAHSPSTLILDCEVKPGIQYPFAGAMYSPTLANAKTSLAKDIDFWTRGDSKTYYVAVFTKSGGKTPALRQFVAGKEWRRITMPFSDFHTDGHDVTLISIVATEPGTDHFELSGFELGS